LYTESQHAFIALESLADTFSALNRWDEAMATSDRTLALADRLLAVGWGITFISGGRIVKPHAKSNDPITIAHAALPQEDMDRNAVIRKRRACTLLSKGHMLRGAASAEAASKQSKRGQASDDNFPAEDDYADEGLYSLEFITALWESAARELSDLEEPKQAMGAFRGTAKAWASSAGIEPFVLGTEGLIRAQQCLYVSV
jgi:hypothetical protein